MYFLIIVAVIGVSISISLKMNKILPLIICVALVFSGFILSETNIINIGFNGINFLANIIAF
jgi:hypothetical protein